MGVPEYRTQRGVVKCQLTKMRTWVESKSSSATLFELQTKMEMLENYMKHFDSIQSKIEILEPDTELKSSERDTFEDSYCELKAKLLSFLFSRQSVGAPASTPNLNQSMGQGIPHSSHKLHKLAVPTFDGQLTNWLEFWLSFKSLVHDNKDILPSDKLQYLKQALKGGKAETVLQVLDPSEENYDSAIKLIKSRYYKKRYLFQSHINSLFDLKAVSRANIDQLHFMVDKINAHMSSMKSIATTEQIVDGLLIYILSSKLDGQTQLTWEDHVTRTICNQHEESNQEEEQPLKYPKWREFCVFIESTCETHEIINCTKQVGMQSKINSSPFSHSKRTTSLLSSENTCSMCSEKHLLYQCEAFSKLSQADRFKEVKKLGLCINCIRGKHSPSSCKSRNCKHCSQRHHSMLHIFPAPKSTQTPTNNQLQPNAVSFQPTQQNMQATGFTQHVNNPPPTSNLLSSLEFLYRPPPSSNETTLSSNALQMPEEVLLSTAIVDAFCINGEVVPCRMLLDSGSQSSFVTESFANLIKCQRKKFDKCIGGIGNVTTRSSSIATIKIKSRYCSTSFTLDALVLKTITGMQPHQRFDTSEFNIPPNIALADPLFNCPQKVDILLGNKFVFQLLCVGQINAGPLTLQKSVLGWIAAGSYFGHNNSLHTLHTIEEKDDSVLSSDIISRILGNFYMAEEIPSVKTKFTAEDQSCEDHFLATHQRKSSGRYVVQLPFKSFNTLGESYQIAIKRFFSLERKLLRDEKLRSSYTDFIMEYVSLGHMSTISTDEWINKPHYFLPHHPVIKEDSSSTKLRVVFDGSSKTLNGKSLNDILMVGPTIQPDLFTLLVKFRLHRYVVAADITKMYRQIEVNKVDQLYQLILWRSAPTEEVKVLKLNTVTYGTSSAAFLAIRSMTHLAEQERQSFPIGSKVVLNDFYVDNLLTGSDSIEELRIIKEEVTQLLKRGGFPLRKWMSNHEDILDGISTDDREKFMVIEDQNIVKALGLTWNPTDDLFVFNPKSTSQVTTKSYTKRYVLSKVGSFFDPLGLLAPIVVAAKLFLRHLWLLQLEWDESLPQHLHTEWASYENQFNFSTSISIPRPAIVPNCCRLELHGFCDASIKAYGACIYVRSTDSNFNTTVRLLCAKSKVSSVKPTITLPRLELCSAVLLAELMSKIIDIFNKNVNAVHCWSDSTIALSWINTSPVLTHTFVSNRIQKIQSLSTNFIWRHVPGELNPADIASRGSLVQDLASSTLWFDGPSFLKEESSKWPINPTFMLPNQLPEYKELNFSFIAEDTIDIISTSKFANNHTRIISVFVYVLRLLVKSRVKGPITNDEIYKTELTIARYLQKMYYPQEYKALANNKSIPRSSSLASLAPFIDDSGTMRVGGRLKHAAIPFDSKHQILLPPSHPYTKALLVQLHNEYYHCGAQSLLYILRQRYWVTSGQRACNSVTHSCIRCAKLRPVFMQQLMANLPKDRITPCHPFSICGVDFCGPFTIKFGSRNRLRTKMYVCLFVCFVTKAVHIEVVTNVSTDAFISTLQQFIARRGKPYKIYSDNATNFVGANNFLKDLYLQFATQQHNDEVRRFCQPDIEWCFIPPRSPHFGGLWESGVKIAKRHMTRKLLNYVPTENELRTIMYQVEAIMNSRPISPMSNDANDLIPLTPGHFLIGRPLIGLNTPSVLELNPNRLNSYQQLQHIIQSFWQSFYKDVLNNQQTRNKNKFPERNLKVDDLVILVDDNLPPLKWRTGIIVKTFAGDDGLVRAVEVRTENGVYRRASVRVCLLPTHNEDECVEPQTVQGGRHVKESN